MNYYLFYCVLAVFAFLLVYWLGVKLIDRKLQGKPQRKSRHNRKPKEDPGLRAYNNREDYRPKVNKEDEFYRGLGDPNNSGSFFE